MANVHEITLAGFDGDTDETDHLVVWVRGSLAEVEALVEGTGASVAGEAPDDAPSIDFTLPKDAEALGARIAEQDAAIAAQAGRTP